MIAGLIKDGRFLTSYLPSGVYAEMREVFLCRKQIPEDIIRIGAGGINEIWRSSKIRVAGIKRAMTLMKAAQTV